MTLVQDILKRAQDKRTPSFDIESVINQATGSNALSILQKAQRKRGVFIQDVSTFSFANLTAQSTPSVAGGRTIQEFTGTFAKEVGQSIARNIGSAALTLSTPSPKKLAEPLSVDDFQTFFGQALFETIFGEGEQIKSIEQRIVEAEPKIKTWQEGLVELAKTPELNTREKFVVETLSNLSPKRIAFIGILGSVGIDLTPFGGLEKNALKALIKERTEAGAKNLLLKMGIDEDLAKFYSPDVVKVSSEKEAKGLFLAMAETQKTTKVGVSISPKLQPLAKEARKFDTAEEFIESQLDLQLKKAGDSVSGLKVRSEIPNQDSISATFGDDFTTLRGVREVPMSEFAQGKTGGRETLGPDFLKSDIQKLADRIEVSGELNPLIVVVDDTVDGFWILEGAHRFDALQLLGKETFPAQVILNNRLLKKSQLTDIFNKVKAETAEVSELGEVGIGIKRGEEGNIQIEPLSSETGVLGAGALGTLKSSTHKVLTSEGRKLVDVNGKVVFPKNTKRSPTPLDKPAFIDETRAAIQLDKSVIKALETVQKKHGDVDTIIKQLEGKGVSQGDLDKIVLEDGTRLVDAVKVKREKNGVLSAVITKQDLAEITEKFTLDTITKKWIPVKTAGQKVREIGRQGKLAALEYYELPQLFFDRTGLRKWFYDPVREAERNAQNMKTAIFSQFEEAGLYKKGSWFTADRFNLTKAEGEEVGRYMLTRQNKNVDRSVLFNDLTENTQEFVRIYDGFIAQTEDRFYKVARLNGKDPGVVENYAALMTSDDIKLAQEIGDMDYIFRKHPAFFSLKKREEDVPFEVYELDYRKVASRWIDQISNFLHLGEVGTQSKYLAQSDEFKELVGEDVWKTTNKWLQDAFNPQVLSSGERGARFGRQAAAVASLGLNYASVIKQMLTQIPLSILERAPPKLSSQFAKDFGIRVADLPSIKERRGNAAIMDMQEGLKKAFVGPLSAFDKKNAQLSLNALLDKNYKTFLKEGKTVSPEIQERVLKMSQDTLDMWYGGMTRSQLPKAFRTEIGKLINMFIMPLTSQLNGFFYAVAKAKGIQKAEKIGEVLAAAVSIAYMEQVITNLSPEWSDEKEMTVDVLSSLAGNIPIISQIVFALRSDQQIQISPALSNTWRFADKAADAYRGNATAVDVGLAFVEMFGLPKQLRRGVQGVQLILDGGVRDKDGKLLAPIKGTAEHIRAFLRGKYGTIATQDWIRNIGVKSENRRWFVPEVEFLQNGDYERKVELYNAFDEQTKRELYSELSEGQQNRLDSEIEKQSAENFFNQLQGLPRQEAASMFDQIAEDNPELAERIGKMKEDANLGITDEDRRIKNMGIKNRERAEHVFEELNKLETKEEKAALWDEYVTKKIITKDVANQLNELLGGI